MYETLLGLLMMFAGCIIIYVSWWYHDTMDDINHRLERDLEEKVKELIEDKKKADNFQRFDIES